MLKSELITLVQQLRTENSTLRTQLDAARIQLTATRHLRPSQDAERAARGEALQRLHALYPTAKSFTAAEVAAEIGCRSCSA